MLIVHSFDYPNNSHVFRFTGVVGQQIVVAVGDLNGRGGRLGRHGHPRRVRLLGLVHLAGVRRAKGKARQAAKSTLCGSEGDASRVQLPHLGWPESDWSTEGNQWPETFAYFDDAWWRVMDRFAAHLAA